MSVFDLLFCLFLSDLVKVVCGDLTLLLSQVAVKGAEFDSREREPHPKCLKGTRMKLLTYIHGLLDKQEKSQLIWLHGTAGVGKSAVAFTVAE
jgi:hypothetical protein